MPDLQITSSAFEPMGTIPTEYTCSGKNISPPLAFSGVPAGASSLALVVDDPDAEGGPFNHWILYDIPSDVPALPENYTPAAGIKLGQNDFGKLEWNGPCPPKGQTHQYYFRLYALDLILGLETGLSQAQLMDQIYSHTLATAQLVGVFGR